MTQVDRISKKKISTDGIKIGASNLDIGSQNWFKQSRHREPELHIGSQN